MLSTPLLPFEGDATDKGMGGRNNVDLGDGAGLLGEVNGEDDVTVVRAGELAGGVPQDADLSCEQDT